MKYSAQKVENEKTFETSFRYQITAKQLSWNEQTKELTFDDASRNKKTVWQLDTYHFFAIDIVDQPIRITSFDHVVNRILSAVNNSMLVAKEKTHKKAHQAAKQIATIINTYDFLQSRGIYYLSEATQDDFDHLAMLLGKGGWILALKLEQKWDRFTNDLIRGKFDIKDAFSFGNLRVYSLKKNFLRKYGSISLHNCSSKHRKILETFLDDSKVPVSLNFRASLQPKNKKEAISKNRLQQILTLINNLENLPQLDNLKFRPYQNCAAIAVRGAKSQDSRTENLNLETAVQLISSCMRFLYEFGPKFLRILDSILNDPIDMGRRREKRLFTEWCHQYQSEYLRRSNPFSTLTSMMQIEDVVKWNRPQDTTSDPGNPTVKTLQGMITTACCVIIQVMNARRISEIIDESDGLKVNSLTVVNEELNLFKCNFFIRKTYQSECEFYVNKTTADAINLLIEIKKKFSSLTKSSVISDSLFEMHSFPGKNNAQIKYVWTKSKDVLASPLDSRSFLAYTFPGEPINLYKPHQSRRFFAILYFYRYDNSDLISLSQHLRHLDLAMTKHYISDPLARATAKNIAASLGLNLNETGLETPLEDDLFKELEAELNAVAEQRLHEFVAQILDGKPLYGGLAKYISRLDQSLSKKAEFRALPPNIKANGISELLLSKQYDVKPMPHGICTAPDKKLNIRTPCQLDSDSLNRHLASPNMCISCRYHITSKMHLECLKHDAEQLESDTRNFRLSPMQQIAARDDHENLLRIIELTDARRNGNV